MAASAVCPMTAPRMLGQPPVPLSALEQAQLGARDGKRDEGCGDEQEPDWVLEVQHASEDR
jgi:hypothetical protein